MNGTPLNLGDFLVAQGALSPDQLRTAQTEQDSHGGELTKALVRLGFITEAALRDTLGAAMAQDIVSLNDVEPEPDALRLLTVAIARRHRVLPLTYDGDKRQLTIAMVDPFNLVALDQITAAVGGPISLVPLLAGESEIMHAIEHWYGFEHSIDALLHAIDTGAQSPEMYTDDRRHHPLVQLVETLISDGVRQGASDIHFGPEEHFLRVRYRIDGVMRQVRILHGKYWPAMAVRIKVLANLNIAENRAPQDGRIALAIHGRTIDFRVSVLPTVHGENIVLRVLDRLNGLIPLDQLGLNERALTAVRFMLARPEGIVLVAGPTGSGKTTTLYSMLSTLNTERVNIMTLEDPVEYPLTGLRQTAVNEAAKLDFAHGIRAMMRQDPDILLVGEIRDRATAEMALRAAMTGHQVFSTLHTNSALGAIPRLFDLGIPPDILAGHVTGVIAQRLVRELCPHCRLAYHADAEERTLLGAMTADAITLWRAQGCVHCHQQGYRGRFALMEVLHMDEELDDLIARRAHVRELRKTALVSGFSTLADDGVRRVLEGRTSLEELARVVDLTARGCLA